MKRVALKPGSIDRKTDVRTTAFYSANDFPLTAMLTFSNVFFAYFKNTKVNVKLNYELLNEFSPHCCLKLLMILYINILFHQAP